MTSPSDTDVSPNQHAQEIITMKRSLFRVGAALATLALAGTLAACSNNSSSSSSEKPSTSSSAGQA